MKQILISLSFLVLVSCVNVNTPVTQIPTVITETKTPVAAISPSPSPITVPSPTLTITRTPEPPCDPFTADFCITEGHFILRRPIQPPGNNLIDPSYRYGSTAEGTREPHHGVEFPNPSGTPVYAAGDGRVLFAASDEQAIYAPWGNFYGNLVVLEHQNRLFTLYAHLSRIDAQAGQTVSAGDMIGEVGSTGGAIGSHLHFEVRQGDVEDYFATRNPELWLSPARDAGGNPFGTLMISVAAGDGSPLKDAHFTISYHADASQSPISMYYATSYSPDLLRGEENTALGELPAGRYRIAVETNGHILERWVEVESGKLTRVVFVAK